VSKVYSIVSVKGGTGKTTTAVNTGLSLTKEGFRVLVIDANLEGSNLAFHLGISTRDITTIHDVIRGRCKPEEAIYTHSSGMNLMLGSNKLEDMVLKERELTKIINSVKKDFDIIILDCSSGLSGSVKSAIKNSDEVLIITNPELPAIVDAHKIVQYCENNNKFIKGIVINKKGKHSDMNIQDIESILNKPILGIIPDDDLIKKAMKERTPIVIYKPKRRSAKEFKNIAYTLGELPKTEAISIWDKIITLFNH